MSLACLPIHPSSRTSRRPAWWTALSFAVWLLAPAARAGLSGDRIELSMYGRVGVAWAFDGKFLQGKSLNLMGNSIGGRFEEGDYLEPTLWLHLVKPEDRESGTYVDAVLTPAVFARSGSFIGTFSNGFEETLGIELFQAYLEAGNVFVPGLTLWGGARFYRGTDVHIADYYYFNNLSGQGAGLRYQGVDVAVILQTSRNGAQYNWDSTGDGVLDSRRQRTVLVGQYLHPLGKHSVQGLGELHVLPAGLDHAGGMVLPADFGWVLGVKGRLALPNDGFNELSVRYGSRAANGSRAGSQTWSTFGLPNPEGLYDGAAGVELVDHFLYNFGPLWSLNAYAILHYNQGASRGAEDNGLDWGLGARATVYLHEKLHLISEATFQGRKDGTAPMGTAVKLSFVPTIVPTGQRSVWARPHLRLIYTVAFYNRSAVTYRYSPYLEAFGPSPVGHYLGTRVEWWF